MDKASVNMQNKAKYYQEAIQLQLQAKTFHSKIRITSTVRQHLKAMWRQK